MRRLEYTSAVERLHAEFPEFSSELATANPDLPHVVFGEFAIYLRQRVRADGEAGFLQRAFGFLNEMADSGDDDLKNLLEVSVLEILADDEECRARAEMQLSDTGKQLLKRVAPGFVSR